MIDVDLEMKLVEIDEKIKALLRDMEDFRKLLKEHKENAQAHTL